MCALHSLPTTKNTKKQKKTHVPCVEPKVHNFLIFLQVFFPLKMKFELYIHMADGEWLFYPASVVMPEATGLGAMPSEESEESHLNDSW